MAVDGEIEAQSEITEYSSEDYSELAKTDVSEFIKEGALFFGAIIAICVILFVYYFFKKWSGTK
jgi:hypothetical protein